jgi:hypothetical protein
MSVRWADSPSLVLQWYSQIPYSRAEYSCTPVPKDHCRSCVGLQSNVAVLRSNGCFLSCGGSSLPVHTHRPQWVTGSTHSPHGAPWCTNMSDAKPSTSRPLPNHCARSSAGEESSVCYCFTTAVPLSHPMLLSSFCPSSTSVLQM